MARRWSTAVLGALAAACLIGLAGSGPSSATVTAPEPETAGGSSPDPPGLPTAGVVRFGVELAGVRLGVSRDEVTSVWGDAYGRCRDCSRETRYYTYEPFAPEGAAVEFADDQVVAAFTLWKPRGWRSAGGLALGTSRAEIPAAYLELVRVECVGYEAFVHTRSEAKTVLYVYDDVLWAFGLMSRAHPVCR